MKKSPAADTPSPTQPSSQQESAMKKITRELVATYNAPLVINHLRPSELPNRDLIIDILSRIKDLLFPDHRLEPHLRQGRLEEFIGELMEGIRADIYRQILLARTYTGDIGEHCEDLQKQSEDETNTFLSKLPCMREVLASDAKAAYDGDPAAGSYDEIIYCYPGFEAVSSYRIAHELQRLKIPLLPRIMTEHAHSLTGCDIHPSASIGRSFFIDHATGVVIGATTVIGDRVKLYQGVTLGALSFSHDAEGNIVRSTKRHPTIEDDVVIYAGATVLGGQTTIGKGSVIGGSCWITRSVPAHSKVLLSAPQMRVQNGDATSSKKNTPTKPGEADGEWCI